MRWMRWCVTNATTGKWNNKTNATKWNFICSVYNLDRFYINGKSTLEKPNIDEHNICIKGGLIRDLIGYSMHEKQDNNV